MSGLVRRWPAKITDLSIDTQAELNALACRIDHVPRRLLTWGHAHRHSYDGLVAMTA